MWTTSSSRRIPWAPNVGKFSSRIDPFLEPILNSICFYDWHPTGTSTHRLLPLQPNHPSISVMEDLKDSQAATDTESQHISSSGSSNSLEANTHEEKPDIRIFPEFAEIDEKKLMRKIDLRLIPWLSVLYLLSSLDRWETEEWEDLDNRVADWHLSSPSTDLPSGMLSCTA